MKKDWPGRWHKNQCGPIYQVKMFFKNKEIIFSVKCYRNYVMENIINNSFECFTGMRKKKAT